MDMVWKFFPRIATESRSLQCDVSTYSALNISTSLDNSSICSRLAHVIQERTLAQHTETGLYPSWLNDLLEYEDDA